MGMLSENWRALWQYLSFTGGCLQTGVVRFFILPKMSKLVIAIGVQCTVG